jgi:hypothetical protein
MAKMSLKETLRIAEKIFFEKNDKWIVGLSLDDAVDYTSTLENNGYVVRLSTGPNPQKKGIYMINAFPTKRLNFGGKQNA